MKFENSNSCFLRDFSFSFFFFWRCVVENASKRAKTLGASLRRLAVKFSKTVVQEEVFVNHHGCFPQHLRLWNGLGLLRDNFSGLLNNPSCQKWVRRVIISCCGPIAKHLLHSLSLLKETSPPPVKDMSCIGIEHVFEERSQCYSLVMQGPKGFIEKHLFFPLLPCYFSLRLCGPSSFVSRHRAPTFTSHNAYPVSPFCSRCQQDIIWSYLNWRRNRRATIPARVKVRLTLVVHYGS